MSLIPKVVEAGEKVCGQYWHDFTRIGLDEIAHAETALSIQLPADFKEFYTEVGCGTFPRDYGGCIYSPNDLIQFCANPIFYITGSRTPGQEWASEEQHRQLWISNGQDNPAPSRFTEDELTYEGVRLWDLLQVGEDGCCGYLQLYVGPNNPDFGCCLLHEGIVQFSTPTFAEGLLQLIDFHATME